MTNMMGDESNKQVESLEDTGRTETSIQKEISKLEYYLEGTDELTREIDVEEIKTTVKQTSKITSKLSELISQLEEFKIDSGISPRTVRQWEKDIKAKYAELLLDKEKFESRKRRNQEESERRKWEAEQQLEEAAIIERHEREQKLWEQNCKPSWKLLRNVWS
ncbi:Hypothetical predicted protein [Paramuricea clavata]|uniref:Uncharacterized protein n=1 Tax=Paramuricea clavata TaxID=317549 RepID=A0A6S7IZB9_PARCT|nr:Hypothetical predicted protein [Paramuricea clavata]